jgi:hypothetical protein
MKPAASRVVHALIVASLCSLIATAQGVKPQPKKSAATPAKPVRIGQHRLGETVEEWLKAAHLDIEDVCNKEPGEIAEIYKAVPPSPDLLKEIQSKAPCHVLTEIRRTGEGKYSTTEGDGRKFDWIFANGFAEQTSIFYKDDIDQQVAFLVEAFGRPADTKIITSQNQYGAKVDSPMRSWNLPDGTSIIATEGFSFQLGRIMLVSFRSKAFTDSINQKPAPKNPYTQP